MLFFFVVVLFALLVSHFCYLQECLIEFPVLLAIKSISNKTCDPQAILLSEKYIFIGYLLQLITVIGPSRDPIQSLITSIITNRIGRHKVLLSINHNCYNFPEKKKFRTNMCSRDNFQVKNSLTLEIPQYFWDK